MGSMGPRLNNRSYQTYEIHHKTKINPFSLAIHMRNVGMLGEYALWVLYDSCGEAIFNILRKKRQPQSQHLNIGKGIIEH